MDNTLITNYVKGKRPLADGIDMTAGYTKKGGWVLNERAGSVRNKNILSLSGHSQQCYRKYSILCILNNRPFEKENAINIYSELRFGRLVIDRRPDCPAWMDLLSTEECLVVNWSMVEWILCPSSPSPHLQLLLLTQRLGVITALVNKSSKFIPSCHTLSTCYILAGIVEIHPFWRVGRHLHVEIQC
jgi:hypothetical protein